MRRQLELGFHFSHEQHSAFLRHARHAAGAGFAHGMCLSTPAGFDRESASATIAEVAQKVRASSDVERHLAWFYEDAALGFDRIYLHNEARDHQDAFIDPCGSRIIPAVARAA